MAPDPRQIWDEYVRSESNRGFGRIPLQATAAIAPISRGQLQAASNLIWKAVEATASGDGNRARKYVERAVDLPYDEHEGTSPAAWEGHMALYTVITDALENSAGDEWLAAVLTVLETASEAMRSEVRQVLQAVPEGFELSPQETRTARRTIASLPLREELIDRQVPPEELTTELLDIVKTVVAYREAMDHL